MISKTSGIKKAFRVLIFLSILSGIMPANSKVRKYVMYKFSNENISWSSVQLLLQNGKTKEAILYLESIKKQATEWPLEKYAVYLKTIATAYANSGDFSKAATYYKLYIPLADSLNIQRSEQDLIQIEDEYRNKEKQIEINRQNKIISLAQQEKVVLIGILCLSIITFCLLYFLYWYTKQTNKKWDEQNLQLINLNKQLDEAGKTKSKLFSIVSNDLKAPINEVYSFLKMQQDDSHPLVTDEGLILKEKIQHGTASLLETMEDLLIWSKSQLEFMRTEIIQVNLNNLTKQCQDLLQLNIESKKLHIINSIPTDCIIATDYNFLQTIVRNLLQNAINASPEYGIIEINFSNEIASRPCLQLKNSGGIFTQNMYQKVLLESQTSQNMHHGFGLRLIDELSKQIQVEVFFETLEDSKTCCSLRFHKI